MRGWAVVVLLGLGAAPVLAQVAPPSILKTDCSQMKGKAKAKCEAANKAGDAPAADKPAAPATDDMPTGADADVPGEPPTVRPSAAPRVKPDTSDMPMGKDADPPAESMGPLKPDGTPDTDAPRGSSSSSSSSSGGGGSAAPGSSASSSAEDEDDAAPTTAGGDSPVKAAKLKDLGSHADVSAAKAKLEANRVADDVKVGRYYMQSGNTVGAEARFKDALQHDPEDPEAHFALAELLVKQNRKDEAAAELKRYLQLAPDDDHTKAAQKLLAKLGK